MMVTAAVRYLSDEWKARPDRAFIYSKETRHQNTTKRDVAITDARPLVADRSVGLEGNGFTFAAYEPNVTDYTDDAAVKASYETVIAPLLSDLTGAREVYVQSHQTRTENPETFLGAYSRYVHCDYPMTPSPEREANVLKAHGSAHADAENLDYAWFNIWAPTDRPAEQNQLTVVDASTLAPEDFEEYYFTPRADGGFAAIPTWNPNHRFYYVSNMRPGEAIVFKQYDSRPGMPKVCPHTAFYDPAVGENHTGRRSVEFRALCVF